MAANNKTESLAASTWTKVGKLFDRLGEILVAVSTIMLLLMMVLMGVEIGDRTLFNTSTQIADEYSGYLFTWMTLCCFLYAQRSDRFLRVDALRSRWSPRVRAAADGIASLLTAALTTVLLYATWATFRTSVEFNAVSIQPSQTPLYLPQVIMPIGFALLLAAFVHSGITSLLQAMGRLPIAASTSPQQASYE
jgi:TRAP-type C4-dicarboxylate transport system permease small subunit